MIPVVGPTGNYICPYCGKEYNIHTTKLSKDHIVPRTFWSKVRYYSNDFRVWIVMNKGTPFVNDDRNIMMVCPKCNRAKNDRLVIPNWNAKGFYRYWSIEQLKAHASYFYFWSNCFIEYLEIYLKCEVKNTSQDNLEYRYITNIKEIKKFQEEYQRRIKTDNWYIGG